MRRQATAIVLLALFGLAGCKCTTPLADGLPDGERCSVCHGSADNAAPPQAVVWGKTTRDVEVGAHQLHLKEGFARKTLSCQECHLVPTLVEDEGHIDLATPEHPSNPADVTFGALATTGNVAPAWSRGSATCGSTYCHGATLHGGNRTQPVWTFDERPGYLDVLSLESCSGCHGAPPPLPHPGRADCASCHDTTVSAGLEIIPGGTHLDGKLDVAGGCSACHGGEANPAPPFSLGGATATGVRSVGAHQAHLNDSPIRKAVGCAECHLVPATVYSPGHADTELPAELTWGTLATTSGVSPSFDGASCGSTYCHGATLQGGSATSPVWTTVDGTQKSCGSCHGDPPPAPHPPSTACRTCHPATVLAGGSIDVDGGHHIDGLLDVNTTCDSCHGGGGNPAPPFDTLGNDATSARGVGAHRQHLTDSPIRKAVGCEACHHLPATADEAGHMDSALPAELTWGPLATADSASAGWDAGTGTCTNYCHGATLQGGSATAPVWTTVDGTQDTCGSCHGSPPPSPHPVSATCRTCHPTTVQADGGIDVDGGHHLDGTLDVNVACNSCHGGAANAAPPFDTLGNSATNVRTVGAHQSHLAASTWRAPMGCADCHLVPATVGAAGHLDSALPAELTWGSLATARSSSASWDAGTETCANYCHGARSGGGSLKNPKWTQVDGTQAACGTCHGIPPPAHYGYGCSSCHDTVDGSLQIIDPARHIDGKVDVSGGPCGSCHGVAPSTGAHQAHYGDSSAPPLATYGDTRILENYTPAGKPYYQFGCGNCHPIAVAKHLDGITQVELSDATAPAGSIKARNLPTAAYDPVARTCANVYCHSSGQQNPVYVTSAAWDGGTQAACNSCHDNPPRYASGGAGTPTANTHLVLADDGWEFGHFAGLPGPWHTSPNRHGGAAGANTGAGAITCQTCHFATVDPANTGPSGFYWLDTSGNYVLPGGLMNYTCGSATCHSATSAVAPLKAGKVLPLRHVNGSRDVVFDQRTTLPASYDGGVSLKPTTPYWNKGNALVEHQLSAATWDAGTKSCGSVSCHLLQTSVQWGATPVGWASCNECHQY